MHAMRGISAHSNGFHTCRALHVLQLLLGAVDAPGSFRFQPPFPKPIPPANRPGKKRRDDGGLDAAPLGFVHAPEDLVVDEDGQPRRIDHAYSWAYPLAAHGMMHTMIRNAWAGDPYRIDTLLMFMANMSWNSAMNTGETMHWLTDKYEDGEYRIPHIIYSDAYASEMVAYADLVLPDTTYLERLRRDLAARSPDLRRRRRERRDPPSDLRSRRRNPPTTAARATCAASSRCCSNSARASACPAWSHADGSPKYRDYADYIVHHERMPGVGLLAGWRGEDGALEGKGAPNPNQLQSYIEHGGFWHTPIPESARYYKMANRDYLQWAHGFGFVANDQPIVMQLYSETLQKFRLAAQGHGAHQPPDRTSHARGDLLRSAADLVRALRTRRDIARNLSAERDHAAPDVHVSRVGFAERVAAADPDAQRAVRASDHGRAIRAGGRRLGRRDSHNGTITVQVRFAGERAARHRVELERDRQAPRCVALVEGCAGEQARASCSTI